MSSAPDSLSPVVVLGEESIYEGPWLSARRVKWRHQRDPADQVRIWEVADRTKKVEEAEADGVVAIPLLTRGEEKFLVCVKQWRIPIGGWSLEFPAGLLDKSGESVADCAARELLEETGYRAGRTVHISAGSQSLDPGLSTTGVCFVVVQIDGDAEENRQPKQNLNDGEEIEVILIPTGSFLATLDRLNSTGVRIEAAVYSFGVALALNVLTT